MCQLTNMCNGNPNEMLQYWVITWGAKGLRWGGEGREEVRDRGKEGKGKEGRKKIEKGGR